MTLEGSGPLQLPEQNNVPFGFPAPRGGRSPDPDQTSIAVIGVEGWQSLAAAGAGQMSRSGARRPGSGRPPG